MPAGRTHVQGIDPACAFLKETIGEAAGGSPDVKSDEIPDIDLKGIESAFKLQSAAAYVGVILSLDPYRRRAGYERPALSTGFSSTRTAPDRIRAWPVPGLPTDPGSPGAGPDGFFLLYFPW
jgi:hypothetical protein